MDSTEKGLTYAAVNGRRHARLADSRKSDSVEKDLVIKKHTPSFFIGTHLDQFLRARNPESIIVTGVSTEIWSRPPQDTELILATFPLSSKMLSGAIHKRLTTLR